MALPGLDKDLTVRGMALKNTGWFLLLAVILAYPIFLQNFDSEVYSFGAPTIIQNINAPALYIGLTATGYVVGIVVFSLFGGYLFDRVSPKIAIILGLGIFSLFSALSGYSTGALELVIFRILDGVGVSIFQVCSASYLGEALPITRGRLLSVSVLLGGLGLFAGPFIVAPFTGNISLPFTIAGMLGLLGIVLFIIFLPRKFKSEVKLETHKYSLSSLKHRNVLLGSLSIIPFGLALFAEVSYVPLYFQKVLTFTSFQATLAVSAFGIAPFVFAIPVGILSDKIGRKPFILLAAAFQVIAGFLLFVIHPPFILAFVLNAMYGFGWGIYFMNMVAIVLDSVPDVVAGLSIGMLYTTFNIGAAFGGPAMGSLIGISWPVAGALSIGIVSILTFAIAFPMKEGLGLAKKQMEEVEEVEEIPA